MDKFILFARPWWVNLLILIPIIGYRAFRKGLIISKTQLLAAAAFGVAFGYVEAAVVVYLRIATGLLPSPLGIYQPALMLNGGVRSLLAIEFFRNVATIVMIAAVAALSAGKFKERAAIFLWVFGFWDLVYYLGLWLMIKWPASLTTPDVLFLVPVPWLSQVWFPYLISGACLAVVAACSFRSRA
ncbi:MAG: hypothetical protein P4L74_03880 [Candidatus Doudnabacteria bacterium]|nr:hypothetical protein [Candidatus Doudnabacteria bacterium]